MTKKIITRILVALLALSVFTVFNSPQEVKADDEITLDYGYNHDERYTHWSNVRKNWPGEETMSYEVGSLGETRTRRITGPTTTSTVIPSSGITLTPANDVADGYTLVGSSVIATTFSGSGPGYWVKVNDSESGQTTDRCSQACVDCGRMQSWCSGESGRANCSWDCERTASDSNKSQYVVTSGRYNGATNGGWYVYEITEQENTTETITLYSYPIYTLSVTNGTISSSEWATKTGGTITSTQAKTAGSYSNSGGVPVLLKTTHVVDSIVITTHEHNITLTENQISVTATSNKTLYFNTSGQSLSSKTGAFIKIYHEAGSNDVSLRFYEITDDINIVVNYKEVGARITSVSPTYNTSYFEDISFTAPTTPGDYVKTTNSNETLFTISSNYLNTETETSSAKSVRIDLKPYNLDRVYGIEITNGTTSISYTYGQEEYTDTTFGRIKIESSSEPGQYLVRFYYLKEKVEIRPLVNYEIVYHLNGGVNSALNPNTFTKSTGNINFKSPTRVNYNFLGWYLDSNLTQPVEEITPTAHTGKERISLYAKWVEAEYDYDGTYYEKGNNRAEDAVIAKSYRSKGYDISCPATVASGSDEISFTIVVDQENSQYDSEQEYVFAGQALGKTYTATEGMTWAEWLSSEYNTSTNIYGVSNQRLTNNISGKLTADGNNIKYQNTNIYLCYADGSKIDKNSQITNGQTYSFIKDTEQDLSALVGYTDTFISVYNGDERGDIVFSVDTNGNNSFTWGQLVDREGGFGYTDDYQEEMGGIIFLKDMPDGTIGFELTSTSPSEPPFWGSPIYLLGSDEPITADTIVVSGTYCWWSV